MGGGGGVVVVVRPGGGAWSWESETGVGSGRLSGRGWDSRRKKGDRGGVSSRGRGVQCQWATVTTRTQNCTNVTGQGEVGRLPWLTRKNLMEDARVGFGMPRRIRTKEREGARGSEPERAVTALQAAARLDWTDGIITIVASPGSYINKYSEAC